MTIKTVITRDSAGAYDTTSIEDVLDEATGETASATNALKSLTTTVAVNTAAAPSAGQVLTASSSTAASWVTPAADAVTSFNTRTGDITLVTDDVTAVLHGADPAATSNTALGTSVLVSITTGVFNTAIGAEALTSEATGSNNTAVGYSALSADSANSDSTAIGSGTLRNATAASNTAVGKNAGVSVTTGTSNILIGLASGSDITTGSNNVVIGNNVALTAAVDNNIAIANGAGTIKAQHDGTNWALTGNVTSTAVVGTAGYTVAGLAGITAPVAGMRAYVTDATTPTYLAALTGGGAVVCPVFYNGTAWVSA